MKIINTDAIDEAQINMLINVRIKAVNQKDIDSVMYNYASDVASFDAVEPLQYSGSDTIRKRLEAWFASFLGFPCYEMSDLKITAANDLAFYFSLNHIVANKTNGGKLDMWWRETVCYRRINGMWLITYVHSSVPFNMHSGKASLYLKPTVIMRVNPYGYSS
jgi:ketosteroid isomerase-like protein